MQALIRIYCSFLMYNIYFLLKFEIVVEFVTLWLDFKA